MSDKAKAEPLPDGCLLLLGTAFILLIAMIVLMLLGGVLYGLSWVLGGVMAIIRVFTG